MVTVLQVMEGFALGFSRGLLMLSVSSNNVKESSDQVPKQDSLAWT